MGYDSKSPKPRLFESTGGFGTGSCNFRYSVEYYEGKVWLYRLSRPLFVHEIMRLTAYLADMVERPYDVRGAMQSGGALWAAVQGIARGEDLTSLFCSELVAETLSHIGVFPTANASRWSPNHLVRKMRRMGILNPPVRLK